MAGQYCCRVADAVELRVERLRRLHLRGAQPFDAAAAVLDGSLLGASETAWISRSALLVSASVVLAMYTTKRLHGALFFVWCAAAPALCCTRPAWDQKP